MKTRKELMKENIVDDMEHATYNSGIATGIAAGFNEFFPNIPDENERKWIIKAIEDVVDGCRTDEGNSITFDKENFGEEDFIEDRIEMLSKLYGKMNSYQYVKDE